MLVKFLKVRELVCGESGTATLHQVAGHSQDGALEACGCTQEARTPAMEQVYRHAQHFLRQRVLLDALEVLLCMRLLLFLQPHAHFLFSGMQRERPHDLGAWRVLYQRLCSGLGS